MLALVIPRVIGMVTNPTKFHTHPLPADAITPYKIRCAYENSVGRRCHNFVTVPNWFARLGYLMYHGWDIKLTVSKEFGNSIKFYCCKQEEHP